MKTELTVEMDCKHFDIFRETTCNQCENFMDTVVFKPCVNWSLVLVKDHPAARVTAYCKNYAPIELEDDQ